MTAQVRIILPGILNNLLTFYLLVLEDGDSGAWVVDVMTNCVYGQVVASDVLGEGYVIPFVAILQQMKRKLQASQVSIPNQFQIMHLIIKMAEESARNNETNAQRAVQNPAATEETADGSYKPYSSRPRGRVYEPSISSGSVVSDDLGTRQCSSTAQTSPAAANTAPKAPSPGVVWADSTPGLLFSAPGGKQERQGVSPSTMLPDNQPSPYDRSYGSYPPMSELEPSLPHHPDSGYSSMQPSAANSPSHVEDDTFQTPSEMVDWMMKTEDMPRFGSKPPERKARKRFPSNLWSRAFRKAHHDV